MEWKHKPCTDPRDCDMSTNCLSFLLSPWMSSKQSFASRCHKANMAETWLFVCKSGNWKTPDASWFHIENETYVHNATLLLNWKTMMSNKLHSFLLFLYFWFLSCQMVLPFSFVSWLHHHLLFLFFFSCQTLQLQILYVCRTEIYTNVQERAILWSNLTQIRDTWWQKIYIFI